MSRFFSFFGALLLTLQLLGTEGQAYLEEQASTSESERPHHLSADIRQQRLAYTHRLLQVYGAGHYLLLDDGSVWQVNNWEEDQSIYLTRGWQAADVLEFHTEGGYFVMNGKTPFEIKNLSSGSKVNAWMDLPPPIETAHYIADIDPNGTHLILDDGSHWQMSWWQSWNARKWRVGDRIFLSHDFKKNYYILYNVDYGHWKYCWVKALLQLP